MTSFNVKFTMIVVLFAIVAGIVACTVDSASAASRPGYLAPSFNTSLVKHADVDTGGDISIAFGSNDVTYQPPVEQAVKPSLFGTFLTVIASMLPNTAAPHGAVTCTVSDGHGGTYTVTRDDCSTL